MSEVLQKTALHVGSSQCPTVERKAFDIFFQLFPCLGGEILDFHISEVFIQMAEDYIITDTIGT